MSYETPKPSYGQENDASSPNLEPQSSELEDLAGELSLEDPLRTEDQPVTSTRRDNPDCAGIPRPKNRTSIRVIRLDRTGNSQNSSSERIAQTQIRPEEEMASAVDPMLMPKLGEDLSSARQLRRDGQLSRAAQHYFKAIRNYIDGGSDPRTQMIVVLVTELLQCMEDVEPSDVPASACDCLDLLHRLQRMYLFPSQVYHSVSSALDKLLVTHPEMPQGVNLHPVVLALEDQGINTPLRKALYSLLALMLNKLFNKNARNEFQFRICLLAFACNLRECLKRHSWAGDVSELERTTWELSTLGKLLESELNAVNWNTAIDGIHRAIGDTSHNGEHFVTGCYSSNEPWITELADACSLNCWAHEAELLFKILRNTQSSNIVSKFRRFQISITYCLHLEREKRYKKLLYGLLALYNDLEYSAGEDWTFIYSQEHASKESKDNRQVALNIRNILDRVSDRLDQYMSPVGAKEITRLRGFFEPAVREKLASENEVNENHLVAQEDRVEAEDDDDQMDDCTSSVKFGVTYTESVITGISFNYSDLYK
jgi:hypothetical protein